MRVKTEAKRQEILAGAAAEFGERGYHETTLAHVAARIGSSKATIYNYFPTKGELFGAMLAAAGAPHTAALLAAFDDAATFEAGLSAFARAFVKRHSGPQAVAVQRLLVAESGKAEGAIRLSNGADLYPWSGLSKRFEAAQQSGKLPPGDAEVMARQFCALLHGDLPLRLLFGARETVDDAEIDASADAAVAFFLAAYRKQ